MSNSYFQFKEFRIEQAKAGMKVTTDGCIFGAWVATFCKSPEIENILDIGTGTGLLSLMLAQNTNARIDAIEIEENAFEEAQSNFQYSPWSNHLTIHCGDIKNFKTPSKYDVIICNPPFFNQSLKGKQTHRNQAIHNDELSATDLANQINRLLSPQGTAYLMFPPSEMESFRVIAVDMELHLLEKLIVQDKENLQPIRVLGQFSRKKSGANSGNLVIKKGDGEYSEDFKHLMKPYYLHL